METTAAEQFIAKLREFASSLGAEERDLLATLLAPGIAQAYEPQDVVGFALRSFPPLPDALIDALQTADIRVIGLHQGGSS